MSKNIRIVHLTQQSPFPVKILSNPFENLLIPRLARSPARHPLLLLQQG